MRICLDVTNRPERRQNNNELRCSGNLRNSVTESLLTSIHSDEVMESFFALDDDDLTMLQKAIARAEAKSKTLRAFIEKAGLPNMEPTEN
jgi:hypothetical protein